MEVLYLCKLERLKQKKSEILKYLLFIPEVFFSFFQFVSILTLSPLTPAGGEEVLFTEEHWTSLQPSATQAVS